MSYIIDTFGCILSLTVNRNMLEKLSRLLKIKQRLRLHPVSESYVFAEVDRFSVSRIEVSVVGSSGRGGTPI